MKTTNIAKIQKELENGFGMSATRNGCEYAWYNAYALDAGIATRAASARAWRTSVIALAEGGAEVTEVTVKVAPNRWVREHQTFTFYFVDGTLSLMVNKRRSNHSATWGGATTGDSMREMADRAGINHCND